MDPCKPRAKKLPAVTAILSCAPSSFLTRTVNTLFAVESDLRNNWSSAHREAIKLVRRGRTQVEMAEILGVTQAAISQRLKHALGPVLEVCAVLDELLAQARWKLLLPWDLRKDQKKGCRQRELTFGAPFNFLEVAAASADHLLDFGSVKPRPRPTRYINSHVNKSAG